MALAKARYGESILGPASSELIAEFSLHCTTNIAVSYRAILD